VEFVTDTGAPAGDFTANLVERMVARGFLLNRIGKGANTLKIRPPMPFGPDHADLLVDVLADELRQMPVPV
jgi:4-aminobutyrate aminotransferase-like enzyme